MGILLSKNLPSFLNGSTLNQSYRNGLEINEKDFVSQIGEFSKLALQK